MVIIILTLPQG